MKFIAEKYGEGILLKIIRLKPGRAELEKILGRTLAGLDGEWRAN